MKTAHHPGVPHHPGVHLGPLDIEWGAMIVPLVTMALVIVMAYLLVSPSLEVAVPTLVDPNFAP